ncbi:MAG: hypothetical protein ACRD44_16635 [Bryobacteraceae bacterium]
MIIEEQGQIVVRRVLPDHSVETSFQMSGKVLGVDSRNIGTYTSRMGPGGTLYGEGQGIAITSDGAMVTWKGVGRGKITAGGGVSYRGSIAYETESPKFARLNSVVGVFEYEVTPEGAASAKTWEWK